MFGYFLLPPQADQVTIKEEKQNPSQVYHWRYAQSEEHPRKKHKKEDKAAAIIKKVLKSHTPKDRNTNDKMKISNLLCGTHVPAPEKVILSLMQSLWSVFNMMPINSPRLNRILCKQQIIRNTKSSLHLRFMCNTSRHKLQSTNSNRPLRFWTRYIKSILFLWSLPVRLTSLPSFRSTTPRWQLTHLNQKAFFRGKCLNFK